MHKYTSKMLDFSPPLTYLGVGSAIFFPALLLGVIGAPLVVGLIASGISFAVLSVLNSKLTLRELIIDDYTIVYVFKFNPITIIDTVIPWESIKLVEFHPFIMPKAGDWNFARGLEPKEKLLRVIGEGNKRLLSTNISDFGKDTEIREIIEDICARKGIPCRQMWKEWGKRQR